MVRICVSQDVCPCLCAVIYLIYLALDSHPLLSHSLWVFLLFHSGFSAGVRGAGGWAHLNCV